MEAESRADLGKAQGWRGVVPYVVVIAAGCWLAAPHLSDEVWYDEAYTLEHFATGTPGHAFTRYTKPNNHVLFSAALSLWRSMGTSPATLRALPLLLFLATLGVLVAATGRLAGPSVGVLAGVMFATAHVTQNFAVQLRGYGPSWLPVAVGLLALPRFLESGSRWWGGLYVAGASIGIGLVPTSLTVFAVFAVWATAVTPLPWRRFVGRLAVVWLAPLAGLLWYVAVWQTVLQKSQEQWTAQTWPNVFGHWLWATLIDFWWLAPLLLLGFIGLARQALRARERGPASPRGHVFLVSACVIEAPLAYAFLPQTPFPRTLVPLLPLWYVVLAVLIMAGWRRVFRNKRRVSRVAMAALIVGMFALAGLRETGGTGYASRNPPGSKPQDLYDQYYHRDFHPARAVALAAEFAARTGGVILTDNSDLWALRYAVLGLGPPGPRLPFFHYRKRVLKWHRAELLESRDILIVTRSAKRAADILAHFRLAGRGEPRPYARTGFLKLYLSPRPGADGEAADAAKESENGGPRP